MYDQFEQYLESDAYGVRMEFHFLSLFPSLSLSQYHIISVLKSVEIKYGASVKHTIAKCMDFECSHAHNGIWSTNEMKQTDH